MKRTLLPLLLCAVVALAGCTRNGESAITGAAYGASSIAGEVFLAGMPSDDPAGVEVAVRGTGMRAVLGPDGRFAFGNIPAGAVLDFQRAADGIEASLQLESAAGFVTVELRQARATVTANKTGRRRAAGRGGEKVFELEGVIRTASATALVVFTSKKEEVSIGLTPETIVREGQTAVAAAELTAGTRVHVKARLANEAYSAIVVIVQSEAGEDDDAPAGIREYQGKVVSATARELVVFTSKKREERFVLTAETVIRRGSASFNFAQILAGMLVHVQATPNADGTKTATLVIVQNTRTD